MNPTQYSFFPWSTASYQRWDVVRGAGPAADVRYFYATTDNQGANPTGMFFYSGTQTARQSDITTLSFQQTGSVFFQPGSIVVVSGILPDSSCNYTGIALDAGSGWVSFLNAGVDTSNPVTAGALMAPIHPYWTTGWYWIPGYSSDLGNQQNVVEARLSEGYSQRFSPVINSQTFSWNLTFSDRTDKESRALANFIQDKGGVTPFVLNFPVSRLTNKANLQYITKGDIKQGLGSYNLTTTTVAVQQVFDLS